MKKVLVIILALVLITVDCYAATKFYIGGKEMIRASEIGKASATIVEAASIEAIKDISFGRLINKASGKVTLNKDNTRTAVGLGLAKSEYSFGVVKIKGPKEHMVNVNIPTTFVVGDNAPNTRFEPTISKGGETHSLANGELDFKIAGTLHLNTKGLKKGHHDGYYVVQASY